jgi:adenylate cyclase
VATLTLPLLAAVPAYLAAALLWTFGAVLAFTYSPLALPLIEPLLAGVVSLGATTGFRFLVADKDRRFLHKTFGLYLAPSVIEKMVTANKPPALGGEIRNVTVFFSDLAGFSSISEVLTPPDLVKFMNQYFSAMTDIIQEHGGLVEKYIGDAIFAVFGAPYDDPDHAGNAVSAALRCRGRLHRLNIEPAEWQRFTLRQRIGLNTGDALVGNVGSRQRFNYTATGDTVNIASRLEGANKYFGTEIMAAKSTFERAAENFAWRELDTVRVQGRDEPVSIYEPLARHGEETPEQKVVTAAYAHALACWRRRDFVRCAEALAPVAAADAPSAILLQRAKKSGASAAARLGRRQRAGREIRPLGRGGFPKPPPACGGGKGGGLHRDRLEPAFGHRRPEHADNDKDNRHRASDETEHADGAVTAEKERDDEAGENRGEPAP